MTAKIKDQHIVYQFEYFNIKQGYITPYFLEVHFRHEPSGCVDIYEGLSVGDEKIWVYPSLGQEKLYSIDKERLSYMLAKSFSDTLLEEVPSLIPTPRKPKRKSKSKSKKKSPASSGAIVPEDADEGGDKDE